MTETQTTLALLGSAEPGTEPLYLVRGFYDGPGGYDTDPDRASNSVAYANLTRAQLLKDYTSKGEIDLWIASGDRRRTTRACLHWTYEVTVQSERLTFDPITRTYMAETPPRVWDSATRKYVAQEGPTP